MIQIADLLLGAVVYEFKYKNKIVSGDKYKIKIYKYIKQKAGINTFVNGNKKKDFNIILYGKK